MIEPSMRGWTSRSARVAVLGVCLAALSACGGRLTHPLGGAPSHTAAAPAIGVNAYLWRASLDTLAFMPLASADPYGGVIITDWYINPEKPDERFKATIYILDARLRAADFPTVGAELFRRVRLQNCSSTEREYSAAGE